MGEAVRHDSCKNDEEENLLYQSLGNSEGPCNYHCIHSYFINKDRSTTGLSDQSPARMPTNRSIVLPWRFGPNADHLQPAGNLRDMGAGLVIV